MLRRILCDSIELNEGLLVENVVAQMLTASGHKLYFFSRSKGSMPEGAMEIDFLLTRTEVARRGNVYAVEVKSGKNTKHVSLDKFREKYKHNIGGSYLLHTKDVMEKDGVIYLPIYMASLL